MTEHEEEGKNTGHSHVRALPTGYIIMLEWRPLSCTPVYATVNVTQGNNSQQQESCSVFAPRPSLDSHKDCFLLSLTT